MGPDMLTGVVAVRDGFTFLAAIPPEYSDDSYAVVGLEDGSTVIVKPGLPPLVIDRYGTVRYLVRQ